MKTHHLFLSAFLLVAGFLSGHAVFSQPLAPSSASTAEKAPVQAFAEERMASKNFIENINEAREDLTMRQDSLALEKIIMARKMLPIIARATPVQRRLTRVEFGGGLYENSLEKRKAYSPIETLSLEDLSRSGGPRWVKSTRKESDAKIIYVTLDLTDDKAVKYLDLAEHNITKGNIREAQIQLAELSDVVIKVDDAVPLAIQARDYVSLADNYISSNNFFGARISLEKAAVILDDMKNEDTYKPHHADIIALHKDIENMQMAFSKLDADQIKTASDSFKKWQQQLSRWAGE